MSDQTSSRGASPRPGRRSFPVRVARWVLIGAISIVVLVVALVVGGILWLRTSSGGEFVRGQIQHRLGELVNGEVRLAGVEGDILTGIELRDFALVDEDGVALLQAERIRVAYTPAPFFDRRVAVARVELVRPEIALVRHDDGRWNFQTIFKERPPPPPGAPPGWGSWVQIDHLEFVDGSVRFGFEGGGWPGFDWADNRFVDLNGALQLGLYDRERTVRRFVARDLSLRATAPLLEIRRIDGEGIWTPDSVALREIEFVTAGSDIRTDGLLTLGEHDSLALGVEARRIDMGEVKRFFPAVRLDGVGSMTGRLSGPVSNPTVILDTATVETGRSTVTASGTLHDLADLRFELDAEVVPLAPEDARLFVEAYPIAQPVRGSVRMAGPLRELEIDADLGSPAGDMTARGTVSQGVGPLAYDLVATSRELDVGALIGRPSVDLVLSGLYRIDGRGTGRDAEALFAGELERSRIYRWDLLALETRGNLAGGVYRADTLIARTPGSVVSGEGDFGLSGDGVIVADLVLESQDPEELWPGLGEFGGVVRGDVRLEGTFRGFDATGDIVAGDLSLYGVTADSFAGTIRLDEVGGPFTMEAEGTFHSLVVAGVVADTASVVVSHDSGSMGIQAFLDHGQEVTTDVTAVADFTGPAPTVTLSRLLYRTPEATWAIASGDLAYREGRVVARELTLSQDGQSATLDGTLALDENTPSDLAFSLDAELSTLAVVAGRPAGDFDGRATVEGRLQGPRAAPVIELAGAVQEGSIYGFRFVRIGGDLRYEDRQAEIDLTVTSPTEGHDIVAAGTVPVDLALVAGVDRVPNREVDLHVEGRNTDLTLLAAFLPTIQDVSGPIDVSVDVTGTTENPRFEGVATLRDGAFRIPATGVGYEAINGRITFNNDEIVIERIDGTDGERGRFEIDGRIAMENLRLGGLAVDLQATDLEVVELSRQEVQMNAALTLTGTTSAPEITGRVEVDEMIYRLPERSRKDIIDLDQAVVYVELPGTRSDVPVRERSPSLWNRTRLDVEVTVTDDAILTASNARIEIAGDLSLFKPAGIGTPTLSGTLDVLGGYYEEFGKRFVIEEGEIFFYGTPEPNPGLHIVASHTVPSVQGAGDVDIRIIVGGTVRAPTIDLESTPAFDKSEIISIALFGTPSVPTGQQSQFEETVTGLFVGTLAGPLQDALAGELGLDAVEYTQRTEETGNVANLFRVGKFITPDVYVTVEQEVGGSEDRQAVGLRYQISRQFTVQGSAGTRQSGVDLFWEFAF
ncbi:MAG TPA: translocation/assembly module TamB domain-containing protein [Gemmatimonadota bacterium]|nr:translocation/assembly module TamB domain-containing protein [Gemmatimonadota bacterium]